MSLIGRLHDLDQAVARRTEPLYRRWFPQRWERQARIRAMTPDQHATLEAIQRPALRRHRIAQAITIGPLVVAALILLVTDPKAALVPSLVAVGLSVGMALGLAPALRAVQEYISKDNVPVPLRDDLPHPSAEGDLNR